MSHSATKVTVNGLDLSQIHAPPDSVKVDDKGGIVCSRFRAAVVSIVWDNSYHSTARTTEGQIIISDKPKCYGGEEAGPTPEDLLLAAVGASLVNTYITALSAAYINVESLKINVSGRVNFRTVLGLETHKSGYDSIQIVVDIQTDAPEDKVTALMMEVFPTAPIPDTILRPVPINVDIIHHAETIAAHLP